MRAAVVSALVDGSLETGHKGELRSWLVARPGGLKDGTWGPEGGREGEL